MYYHRNSDTDRDNTDWWIYNKTSNEWTLYKSNVSFDYYPDNMSEQNIVNNLHILAQEIGEEYENLLITRSRNYIDAGHHQTPATSYYYNNGKLYYFLHDAHYNLKNGNNTGWYVYDDSGNEWNYFSLSSTSQK